jgi:hypothetical protein
VPRSGDLNESIGSAQPDYFKLLKTGGLMKDSTRARVAAIVGAVSRQKSISSIYDYSSGSHRNTSVSIKGGKISGYDYTTSSHFSGGGSGSLDFYDYETSKHVQLKMNRNNFDGYDYHSGKHFSGTVNGSSVSLYDYETAQHHNFSV